MINPKNPYDKMSNIHTSNVKLLSNIVNSEISDNDEQNIKDQNNNYCNYYIMILLCILFIISPIIINMVCLILSFYNLFGKKYSYSCPLDCHSYNVEFQSSYINTYIIANEVSYELNRIYTNNKGNECSLINAYTNLTIAENDLKYYTINETKTYINDDNCVFSNKCCDSYNDAGHYSFLYLIVFGASIFTMIFAKCCPHEYYDLTVEQKKMADTMLYICLINVCAYTFGLLLLTSETTDMNNLAM